MREILFRGKRTDNGEWVYGFYCPVCFGFFPCSPAIICKELMDSGCWKPEEVIPETVGQYTGLNDKNGKKIFEGDTVSISGELKRTYTCVWEEYNFEYEFDNKTMSFGLACVDSDDIEVIGNIHDNPELIGGKKNG